LLWGITKDFTEELWVFYGFLIVIERNLKLSIVFKPSYNKHIKD